MASGLKEALPSIRWFYGLGLFSCIECDGNEHSDKPLALIGETSDLASRALLIAQWSHNLTDSPTPSVASRIPRKRCSRRVGCAWSEL